MKTCIFVAACLLTLGQSYTAYAIETEFNATFDTLIPLPEEGPLSPVGTYLNLSYSSFDFGPPDSATVGLTPQSAPYFAYGVGSAPAITIPDSGSDIESFALGSFYFGCIINEARATPSLPVPCNVTVSGYAAGSEEPVVVQTFVFSPAAGWKVPLTLGLFEAAFQGLGNVTFVQSPAVGTELVVDDILGFLAS